MRQAQSARRKELPGAHAQWPRASEVILRRSASDNGLLTKEEGEGFGHRMRRAARINEFTEVVDNAIIEDYASRHRLVRSSTYHA